MSTLITVHDNLNKMLINKKNALPSSLNKERFIQNCMVVLKDVKDIEKMEPQSVARTMLKGAFLGLDFFMRECYAIPYGNNLNFQTDYKGEVKLIKKYSIRPVLDMYAKVVREGDSLNFGITDGKQYLGFEPIPFSAGPIIGCFAICLFKDGGFLYETMSKKDVEFIRDNYSKQPKGKAWQNFQEMAKKTVIRRLRKAIHVDFENLEQAKTFEEATNDCNFNDIKNITPELKKPEPLPQPINKDKKINEKQLKKFFAIQKESGLTDEQVKPIIESYDYKSRKDILVSDYESIIELIISTGKANSEFKKC